VHVLRLTHDERERQVLTDLDASFPDFMGKRLTWRKIPDGQDPPDFIGTDAQSTLGLELVEWLDGDQMTPAIARESQRERVHRTLILDSENEFKPTNIRLAFPTLRDGNRAAAKDFAGLRNELYAFAAKVDGAWTTDTRRWGSHDSKRDFPGFPLLTKYFDSINFVGGLPLGGCWIDMERDGGSYDPNAVVDTLNERLDRKLTDYSTSDSLVHLSAQKLGELALLVHGGWNIEVYNNPAGPLTLTEIARRGAAYYAAHPRRDIFRRVWFFHSVDSADDVNTAVGIEPDAGRVRWLAQLWPTFEIHPGSKPCTRRAGFCDVERKRLR
jgi:hypothetical protein